MTIPPDSEPRATLRFEVPAGQTRVRLDVFLTRQVENATRSKVQSGIVDGWVTVNGQPTKSSYSVQPGDLIIVTLPHPPAPEAAAENIPVEIVYEDEDLLIVNKPAGMVTHPAHGNYTGTLVNALLYHVRTLSAPGGPMRPGIVHRLDKDTSGLMVVAKSDAAHAHLARQFSARTIEREYQAIVWGRMRNAKGTIDAALARSARDRKKVAVRADGKAAVTEYSVLENFEYLTLLKLKLRTGRTHQIRVHLAHISHPVFGDATYGGRTPTWGGMSSSRSQQATNLLKLISRQALHARTIGFVHPRTGRACRFDSPLPDDIVAVLTKLRP